MATSLDLARMVERGFRQRGIVEFTAKTSVRDVGLDFGGGRRRTVVVRNARLAKCSGRLRQIGILSRSYAPASRLSSSGAVPAALYGEETMGLPAALLEKLENQMIMAAGMDPRAGCPAAMFEIAYGRRKDPWVVYLRDLLTSFFDVFRRSEGSFRAGIVRTWARAAKDVATEVSAATEAASSDGPRTASLRCRKVGGTIGAVVNSLADLHWKAPSPFGLSSPTGAAFRFDASSFDGAACTRTLLADLLDELGQSVYRRWW